MFKDTGKKKLGNAGSVDVFGAGSEDGANVLRTGSELVVLTGTVSRLSASEAQFLPDTASSFHWG